MATTNVSFRVDPELKNVFEADNPIKPKMSIKDRFALYPISVIEEDEIDWGVSAGEEI